MRKREIKDWDWGGGRGEEGRWKEEKKNHKASMEKVFYLTK